MELLFAPFMLFGLAPGLGLVPALLFGGCLLRRSGSRRRRIAMWLALVSWTVYGCYETWVYFWARTVVAPIRVDLLLIAPLLYVVTAVGIWGCLGARSSK